MSRARRSSVLTMEQQNFLERRLQNRPADTRQQVPVQGVAPALQGMARRLERSMISDNLTQKLFDRDEEILEREHLFRAGNVAPRLREAKLKLEHSITRDQVGHLLEGRPDPDDLVRAGISQPMDRAHRIQQMSRKLERSMTQDKVSHLLERRSEIGELQNRDILKDMAVAPGVQKAQQDLQKNLAKSNLYHALKYRPSIAELQEQGVYPMMDDDYFEYEGDEDDYYYDEGDEYYDDEVPQDYYEDQYYDEEEEELEEEEEAYEQVDTGYQRRSKNFHLTRILLKFVASMGEAGELTVEQKGYLKDLIVDQDQTILAVSETFDAENDLHDFKDSLVRLASR